MWRSAVQLCQSLQGRPTRPAFFFWGYSSAGRAHALQAWGRRFESDYLHPMRLTLSSRPLFLFSRPAPSPLSVSCRPPSTLGALSPAGQGGTGDPRLPCRTRPSLRRHPLAGGGMSPHAAPSRPFALAIHQIGHFRGRTAHFALAIHQIDVFGGRTALLRWGHRDTCQHVNGWSVVERMALLHVICKGLRK